MRVTGGRLGGRALVAPDDARVRPTSDKVRQAMFNILEHNDFGMGFAIEGARVADLFAGTGALGIEALSRGAVFATLIDDDADSRALIRRNVEALGLTGVTKIWRRDATALGKANDTYELVFIDPPYRKNLVAPTLASLREGGWLSERALVVPKRRRMTLFRLRTVSPRSTRGPTVTREFFSCAPVRRRTALKPWPPGRPGFS
jgi:16S rRNA (guanine966-N2)-methyltransferase